MCCNGTQDQQRRKLRLGLVDSEGTQRQVTVRTRLLVCAHTQKQGQRQIRCHSDCHEGDKLCQVFSLRGEKRRGGAEYGPNTHKILYSDTTTHLSTHIQTWNGLLAETETSVHAGLLHTHTHTHTYKCAHTYTHTVKRCYRQIHQSRAHQGARKLFDSKSLFTSPKADFSEYQLVDLV